MPFGDCQFEISLPPYNPDAQRVKAIAKLRDNCRVGLPHVDAAQERCIYNHTLGISMMKIDGERIAVDPGRRAAIMPQAGERARETLDWFKGTIVETISFDGSGLGR